jgi:hypothetical protein
VSLCVCVSLRVSPSPVTFEYLNQYLYNLILRKQNISSQTVIALNIYFRETEFYCCICQNRQTQRTVSVGNMNTPVSSRHFADLSDERAELRCNASSTRKFASRSITISVSAAILKVSSQSKLIAEFISQLST